MSIAAGPVTALIEISHHTFTLMSPSFGIAALIPNENGLIVTLVPPGVPAPKGSPGQFGWVCTGTSVGPVRVTIEIRDTRPEQIELAYWDEVVEVSFDAPEPGFGIVSIVEDESGLLPGLPPGPLRVRAHARGRDAAVGLTQDGPTEEHFLLAWPAAPTPEERLKLTDQFGALRRGESAQP